ncbi:MAG: helix-turn-helix domain-containing protein [Clostridia bacterium]|nr:helix-turn-helix domain-containing protein [Clostridia bacterium]
MNSHLKLKNKLKEFRQAKGLTQKQLADMVGSSKNTISSIETSQFCPTAYLAALLCVALECKFEDLFYLNLEE